MKLDDQFVKGAVNHLQNNGITSCKEFEKQHLKVHPYPEKERALKVANKSDKSTDEVCKEYIKDNGYNHVEVSVTDAFDRATYEIVRFNVK